VHHTEPVAETPRDRYGYARVGLAGDQVMFRHAGGCLDEESYPKNEPHDSQACRSRETTDRYGE
jgi:hypothetical protein